MNVVQRYSFFTQSIQWKLIYFKSLRTEYLSKESNRMMSTRLSIGDEIFHELQLLLSNIERFFGIVFFHHCRILERRMKWKKKKIEHIHTFKWNYESAWIVCECHSFHKAYKWKWEIDLDRKSVCVRESYDYHMLHVLYELCNNVCEDDEIATNFCLFTLNTYFLSLFSLSCADSIFLSTSKF